MSTAFSARSNSRPSTLRTKTCLPRHAGPDAGLTSPVHCVSAPSGEKFARRGSCQGCHTPGWRPYGGKAKGSWACIPSLPSLGLSRGQLKCRSLAAARFGRLPVSTAAWGKSILPNRPLSLARPAWPGCVVLQHLSGGAGCTSSARSGPGGFAIGAASEHFRMPGLTVRGLGAQSASSSRPMDRDCLRRSQPCGRRASSMPGGWNMFGARPAPNSWLKRSQNRPWPRTAPGAGRLAEPRASHR